MKVALKVVLLRLNLHELQRRGAADHVILDAAVKPVYIECILAAGSLSGNFAITTTRKCKSAGNELEQKKKRFSECPFPLTTCIVVSNTLYRGKANCRNNLTSVLDAADNCVWNLQGK
jgi:hypothetical protein